MTECLTHTWIRVGRRQVNKQIKHLKLGKALLK